MPRKLPWGRSAEEDAPDTRDTKKAKYASSEAPEPEYIPKDEARLAAIARINKYHEKPLSIVEKTPENYDAFEDDWLSRLGKPHPHQPDPMWILEPERIPMDSVLSTMYRKRNRATDALQKAESKVEEAKKKVEELEHYLKMWDEIIARGEEYLENRSKRLEFG